MKKNEKIEGIEKRIYQYARSGKYNDYLSIEIELKGLPEAIIVLKNYQIRDKIDTLCKIAISSDEVQRRKNYREWINYILQNIKEKLKKEYGLSIDFQDEILYVHGSNYSLEISRKFDSNEIEIHYEVTGNDRKIVRFSPPEIIKGRDFSNISEDEFTKLILRYAEKVANTAKHF